VRGHRAAEDEAAALDAGDLRVALAAERRGERGDRPREQLAIGKRAPDVRAAVAVTANAVGQVLGEGPQGSRSDGRIVPHG
jgi:hypothetical protein